MSVTSSASKYFYTLYCNCICQLGNIRFFVLVISSGREFPWLSFINKPLLYCCKTRIVKWGIWHYSSIFDCVSFLIKAYLSSCQSFTLLQLVYLKGVKSFYSLMCLLCFTSLILIQKSSENLHYVHLETHLFDFCYGGLHVARQIKFHWDLLLWDGLN